MQKIKNITQVLLLLSAIFFLAVWVHEMRKRKMLESHMQSLELTYSQYFVNYQEPTYSREFLLHKQAPLLLHQVPLLRFVGNSDTLTIKEVGWVKDLTTLYVWLAREDEEWVAIDAFEYNHHEIFFR